MRAVVDLRSRSVSSAGDDSGAEWWITHCRPGRGETVGFPGWTVRQAQEKRWAGIAASGKAVERPSVRWEETREKWVKACVPGDVHLDLLRAGIIPEPMEGRNFAELEWVEQEEWWYLCSFNLTEEQVEAGRTVGAELVFEGIDTQASIWLNGRPVGRTGNMFRTFRFTLRDELKPGENTLAVKVDVGLAAVQDKSLRRLARSWNQDDLRRLWLRKAQFGFGWDWNPRLVSCGIWRPVRLEFPGAIVLRNICVRETLPSHPLPSDRPVPATVYIEAEVDCALPKFTDVVVAATWTPLTRPTERSFTEIFQRRLFPGRNWLAIRMELPEVWLWWPWPLGTPFLYELQLSVSIPEAADETGQAGGSGVLQDIQDELRLRYGFRRVELRQTPRPMVMPDTDEEIKGLPPGEATTFTFFVNGIPIFAQGGNWVPADCLPARVTPEKYRFLLGRAIDAGCNMLRVWGGGIYEHPLFYDLCDELGIMVWQEFMFACGYYPDFDAQFRAEVEAEAEDVLRRLRHHPCIVVWAGNNEIATMAWGHWKWGGPIDPDATLSPGGQTSRDLPQTLADIRQYPGQRLFEEILAGVCARLDPSRPYLPSSPMSQPGVEPDYPWQGDTHTWYPGVDYEKDYGRDATGFCSEFGCVGPADVESLCQAVPTLRVRRGPGGELWPAGEQPYAEILSQLPELRDHVHPSEEAMVRRRLVAHFLGSAASGLWRNRERRDSEEPPKVQAARQVLDWLPLADWVRLGQLLQAEVLRYAFSHYRRRLWDCSGSLMWMWDDAWPETGWTPIDYYGRPKALYFVLRRLFRPVSLVWRKVRRSGERSTFTRVDRFELYGINMLREPVQGRLRYGWWRFDDAHPELVEETVEIPPLCSLRLGGEVLPPSDPILAATGAVYGELAVDGLSPLQAREFAVPWGELVLPRRRKSVPWFRTGVSAW
ncbi:MAG: hypothetical protein IMX00_07660 [Limnochordales bacterium]|nr:hypothetical protein [Limnochordales bacterium]